MSGTTVATEECIDCGKETELKTVGEDVRGCDVGWRTDGGAILWIKSGGDWYCPGCVADEGADRGGSR